MIAMIARNSLEEQWGAKSIVNSFNYQTGREVRQWAFCNMEKLCNPVQLLINFIKKST